MTQAASTTIPPKTLTKRADFLRANSGIRNARAGFVLLTRPNDGQGIRFGIRSPCRAGSGRGVSPLIIRHHHFLGGAR